MTKCLHADPKYPLETYDKTPEKGSWKHSQAVIDDENKHMQKTERGWMGSHYMCKLKPQSFFIAWSSVFSSD